jgi:hypothetical protein
MRPVPVPARDTARWPVDAEETATVADFAATPAVNVYVVVAAGITLTLPSAHGTVPTAGSIEQLDAPVTPVHARVADAPGTIADGVAVNVPMIVSLTVNVVVVLPLPGVVTVIERGPGAADGSIVNVTVNDVLVALARGLAPLRSAMERCCLTPATVTVATVTPEPLTVTVV